MTEPLELVMQVWFRPLDDTRSCGILAAPHFDGIWERQEPLQTIFSVPLFRSPSGNAVFEWAVDYIVCTDRRWCMFGPFDTLEIARAAFDKISELAISENSMTCGFRLFPKHCFESRQGAVGDPNKWDGKVKEWPRSMWTDG